MDADEWVDQRMTDRPTVRAGCWWRPLDLVVAVVLAIVAALAVQWPTAFPAVVRVVSAGSLGVFVVGYTLLEAVFPQPATASDGTPLFRPVERVGLALALSVVVVPLTALGVEYAPLTLEVSTILTTVSGLTLCACVVAWIRRWLRAGPQQGRSAGLGGVVADRAGAWRSASTLDRTLDVVVVLSLVFATVTVAAVPLHDPTREPYTELTVLTENESGVLVADDYPRNMTRDGRYRTCLVVGNHEQQPVDYTIQVVQTRRGGDTSTAAAGARTVNRTQLDLDAGETRVLGIDIQPAGNWSRLTVRYRLYNETQPPADANRPYRMVSFPVTVTPSGGDTATAGAASNATCRRQPSTAS